MPDPEGAKTSGGGRHDPRLAATRLAAVQAVYELDMMDATVDEVLAAFMAERWAGADDEATAELARPRPELLRTLVAGSAGRRAEIDAHLAPALAKGRELGDLEAILRAILRTATFELLARDNVPARAVISAYVGVGDAFFDEDGGQTKLIAGVLNAVARTLRPAEFAEAG